MWKPVKGYEGFYDVSNRGRVRSWCTKDTRKLRKDKCVLLSFGRHPKGYLSFFAKRKNGKRKSIKIHHAVLTAFVGPRPNNCECAHLDGNPGNNNLKNLKWVSAKENTYHKWLHGTMWTKINANRAKCIKQALLLGCEGKKIAKEFNVSTALVSMIKNNKIWRHI